MLNSEPANHSEEAEQIRQRYLEATKRAFSQDDAAELRERQFYLERLRFRLRELGVSPPDPPKVEGAPVIHLEARASPPATLSHKNTAILVIHGIGQQNPYETLDQFARNLTRYLKYEGGIEDLTLEAARLDHNDWVEARVRLHTSKYGPQTNTEPPEASVDLYEYYWAPQTQDKISYRRLCRG
jgi:hypothetical protein